VSQFGQLIQFGSYLWKVDSSVYPKGLQWIAVCWIFIPEETWAGPHPLGYGFQLAAYSTTSTHTYVDGLGVTRVGNDVNVSTSIPIDSNIRRGKWHRLEAVLDIKDKQMDTWQILDVQIWCPRGGMYIDNVQLTFNEQTSFFEKDQGVILKGIVEHAQDENYDKSDLNIEYAGPTNTGILRERIYEHSEHGMIGDAIDEFPTLHQGMDWSVEPSLTGPRKFMAYYPTKGTRRSDIRFRFDTNIVDYTVDSDGIRVSNSIVVLGEGEGSDREEGGSVDTLSMRDPRFAGEVPVAWGRTATYSLDQLVTYRGVTYYSKANGNTGNMPPNKIHWGIPGLTLEKVYHATPGGAISSLGQQAKRGVDRYKRPLVIPNVTVKGKEFIGNLNVGDVCHFRFSPNMTAHDGNPAIPNDNPDGVTGWYRVHKITVKWKTLEMELEINPVSEEFI
jgi:hypothetical protein